MEWALAVLAMVAVAGWLLALRAARARDHARDEASRSARSAHELAAELGSARETAAAMELVLSSMQDAVALVARDGRIRLANPAATALLGAATGAGIAVLPATLHASIEGAMSHRATRAVEVRTGPLERWLWASAIPVGDGDVLLVARDVTEAKRIDAVRRDFVANASHELKTPAATIQATAETIATAAHDDPAVVPRFAERLEAEAVRLSRIVSDLLDLTRLESGSELREEVRLDRVVGDETSRCELDAQEAGVRLVVDAPTTPVVLGSLRDLALLVRNLVDNAIRYTKPGGEVEVRVAAGDGEVVLTVRDTGVGIPSRDLPRLFERFYRVDPARSRETGGTGLGLSIVKHVAENHHGSVRVESELGRGSRFEVRIPVAPVA